MISALSRHVVLRERGGMKDHESGICEECGYELEEEVVCSKLQAQNTLKKT